MQTLRPIIPATGEKFYSEVDYADASPHAINFTRTFRSRWSVSGGHTFGLIPGAATPGLGASWAHSYTASLSITGNSTAILMQGSGGTLLFNWISGSWEPSGGGRNTLVATNSPVPGYLLTRTDDDTRWQFDAAGKLMSVTARNGWTMSYIYNNINQLTSVTNAFGRSVNFVYDGGGRLTSMIPPDGRIISYGYDSAQRSATVTYPGNVVKTYQYEDLRWPQSVTGIIDENGSRLATVVYDAQGRAIQSGYALGADQYNVTYPATVPWTSAQVTDPLGTTRTYNYGTTLGKLVVTGASLPSGGGGDAASRVQNASGLIDSETDYIGVQTMYTWDINRRLPISTNRAAGSPLAKTTATQWHATFHVPILITEPTRTTAYTYDTQGSKLSEIQTDTQTGQGRSMYWTYNGPQGLVDTAKDTLNRVTRYAYYADTSFAGVVPNKVGHTIGDLQTITNPAGQVTQFTKYDPSGRLLESIDSKGIVTTNTYTPRGWIASVTVTPPAGVARLTSYTYDNVGQLTAVSTPDGQTIGYTYDAAHRLVGASDTKGNSVTYTLDNMGNRVGEQVKDPQGTLQRSMTRAFDALNRVQQVSGALQ